MRASEIIEKLTPEARALLAEVPGYPVAVGAVPLPWQRGHVTALGELQALGVAGQRGGLTVKGAVVADRIKAKSELF